MEIGEVPEQNKYCGHFDPYGARIPVSEHIPNRGLDTLEVAPAPAMDRRKKQRVRVSLELRIRPADFGDGAFEEVRITLNASRNALYFFTHLNRYYRGMPLRITSPYGSFAGSGNWEDTGEVVRVHRRWDGFGVAVLLSSPSHLVKSGSNGEVRRRKSVGDAERRCDLRCSFIASAELIDIRAGVRLLARTSDLSLSGCYIDTLNPFHVGTSVKLRISKGTEVFEGEAKVSSKHHGSGMGLVFQNVAPADRATLEYWLSESFAPAEPPALMPARLENPVQRDGASDSRAIRLIRTLVRKGVLSQSEANDLLRDPDF